MALCGVYGFIGVLCALSAFRAAPVCAVTLSAFRGPCDRSGSLVRLVLCQLVTVSGGSVVLLVRMPSAFRSLSAVGAVPGAVLTVQICAESVRLCESVRLSVPCVVCLTAICSGGVLSRLIVSGGCHWGGDTFGQRSKVCQCLLKKRLDGFIRQISVSGLDQFGFGGVVSSVSWFAN